MPRDRRFLLTAGVCAAVAMGLALATLVAMAVLLVAAELPQEQQRVLQQLLSQHGWLAVLGVGAVGMLGAWTAPWIHRRYVAAPARLAEQVASVVASGVQRDLEDPRWSGGLRELAREVGALARQRDQLREDIAEEVARASRGIEQERSRLAALMSELSQSVVVCNLDGRILLYNNRARMQFRALSDAPTVADGSDLMGLGRSIYTVFDRQLVAHALENLQQRLARGAGHPVAQFVTATRSGQLLRAQMAPVRGVEQRQAASDLTGFVLMLENITTQFELDSARERRLHGLIEGGRGALANLQAALEVLDDLALDQALRERLLTVVREEVKSLSQRIQQVAADSARDRVTRWPLEEMRGGDFLQAAARRVEVVTGCAPSVEDMDPELWLKIDSFSMLQSVVHLSQRILQAGCATALRLCVQAQAEGRACLDLGWTGPPVAPGTAEAWAREPMAGGSPSSALSVPEVVERHEGEFWFERTAGASDAFRFRFLLPPAPLAAAREQLETSFVRSDSRPEYYDFDLFASAEGDRSLDDRPLADLSFTVFDTETTGLDPAGGDEILQIGAVRVVNGRILRAEGFDQLIDPRRSIPAASVPIHGITPEMVAGKPAIAEVLPAFHRYAQDTVLVAHNAAFDMRFLQLKESATGVRFDQPLLDTLLLSAVVHPNQEAHSLEAIAERFGVTVIGRHTAVGDALVTAEVFLKLIPLLAERGIRTLGQAREAAQKTWYARLEY